MDEVDRKIISRLQMDGRTTLEELGKEIGYSSMGVQKRIKKLLEGDVIKVSALLNTEQVDLRAAVVLLETESGEVLQKLLARFKNCPRVVQIFTTLGGYNLMAIMIAEDQSTLESISMEKCSIRSMEGIRRSEIYPISGIHFSPHLPVREYLVGGKKLTAPCGVYCRTCASYNLEKCVGCPATTCYRGHL